MIVFPVSFSHFSEVGIIFIGPRDACGFVKQVDYRPFPIIEKMAKMPTASATIGRIQTSVFTPWNFGLSSTNCPYERSK